MTLPSAGMREPGSTCSKEQQCVSQMTTCISGMSQVTTCVLDVIGDNVTRLMMMLVITSSYACSHIADSCELLQ